MCGIIAAFNYGDNKQPVNNFIVNQYQEQIMRGTEGFGVILIDKDNKVRVERAVSDSKALADLYLNPSEKIIFHHRLPSSSDNKMSQTHPIEVESGSLKHKYLIIHNGVIRNSDERLEEQKNNLGFHITTEVDDMVNDSEALAIDIARFIEGQSDEIESAGPAAFIALRLKVGTMEADKVYYGRNAGNPLNLAMSQGSMKLSSEGPGIEIKQDMLYSFDLDIFKIEKRKMEIPTVVYSKPTVKVLKDNTPNSNEIFKQINEDDEIDDLLDDAIQGHRDAMLEELEELIMDITNPDSIFDGQEDAKIQHYLPSLIEQLKVMHADIKKVYTEDLINNMEKEEEEKQEQTLCFKN